MNTLGPLINYPCMLCWRPTSMRCSRCQRAWYCTQEHLQIDWPRHRRECIPASCMQNYNMITTPPPTEQQAITRTATLFEPKEATSTSSTGPSVPYKMDSLVHSWVSNSSIPSSRIPVVTAIEDHGLHADMPNRRSYTLLDIPVPPEAHKRPVPPALTRIRIAEDPPSPEVMVLLQIIPKKCTSSKPRLAMSGSYINNGLSVRRAMVPLASVHAVTPLPTQWVIKLMSMLVVRPSDAFAWVQKAEYAYSISTVALSRPTSKMCMASKT
ncbi:hypothetical protein PISMIDRAFT_24835 [Pisolithus microcarpus 441]|uniref:MYND-type domain-containing protein n=1 Tax=Pisolithus microcarpus 441 TaxID=765257 RepID=A0A0C9YLX5_9AGAM|nr:hypothetical protein PISMIDRAFT_24835 [Pisolithus microcarpus 441]